MRDMRAAAVAAIAICASACHAHEAPAPVETARTQVEVRLEATGALPSLLIEAYFDAELALRPHVQPLTAAVVAARGACAGKQDPAAVMKLTVHDRRIAIAPGDHGCLASALQGSTIDDDLDYTTDLVVRVGA
jgi:hypothetical protein